MTSHWSWYGSLPGRIRQVHLHGTNRLKVGMPQCRSFTRRPESSHPPIHSGEEAVRKPESSGAFRSKTKPTNVDNAGPQMTHVGEDNSRHGGANEKARRAADCARHMTMCSPRRVGLVHRLDSLCPWNHDPNTGETSCCIEGVTSRNTRTRTPTLRKQNDRIQGMPPTTALQALQPSRSFKDT